MLRKYISLLPVSRFHSKACWMRDSSYNLQGGDAIAHRRPPLDNARQLNFSRKPSLIPRVGRTKKRKDSVERHWLRQKSATI